MRPVAVTGLAAEAVDLLRTAGSPATRVPRLLAVRVLAQVLRRVRLGVVPLRVRHSRLEVSTVGSTDLAACDSGPMASGGTATTTAMDAWVLMGGDTRVSTTPIGGRILVRRSTMTSNTRPAWLMR